MTLSSVRYSGKQVLTPALPFVDNLAASHRKIVLFGDAGDGKTTLLRMMARQFCAKGMLPMDVPPGSATTVSRLERRRVNLGQYLEKTVLRYTNRQDFPWGGTSNQQLADIGKVAFEMLGTLSDLAGGQIRRRC